jgi:Ca2+-binding RTX toxin-like protein
MGGRIGLTPIFTLVGEARNDTLYGGAGNDIVNDGPGSGRPGYNKCFSCSALNSASDVDWLTTSTPQSNRQGPSCASNLHHPHAGSAAGDRLLPRGGGARLVGAHNLHAIEGRSHLRFQWKPPRRHRALGTPSARPRGQLSLISWSSDRVRQLVYGTR